MLDARRMEVYTALFDKDLNFIEETNSQILDENSFKERMESNKICFFGDGAFKMKNFVRDNFNASFIEGVYPSAKNIGELALISFEKKEFEDTAYFEPFYLKDFVSTQNN
jgi:tRNA threonylcarbamoyladenosine biosynthesis protein TsaB